MKKDWKNCINYEVSSKIIAKNTPRNIAKTNMLHMAYHWKSVNQKYLVRNTKLSQLINLAWIWISINLIWDRLRRGTRSLREKTNTQATSIMIGIVGIVMVKRNLEVEARAVKREEVDRAPKDFRNSTWPRWGAKYLKGDIDQRVTKDIPHNTTIDGRKREPSCKVHCKCLLAHSLLQVSVQGVQGQVVDSRMVMAIPKSILNLLMLPKVRRGQNQGQDLQIRRARKRVEVEAARTIKESKVLVTKERHKWAMIPIVPRRHD